MDNAYLSERITKTKAMIEAYENAILALASGSIESYDLDTGQTRQRITKQNVGTLQKVLDTLYNRLCVFQSRLNGGNTVQVIPAW